MPHRRLFGEDDISRILKRAATLQEADVAGKDPMGLTLEELQQVAADAGLDPAYVVAAVRDLDHQPPEPDGRFYVWGAPVTLEIERYVDAPLREEAWAEAVGELRSRYKKGGTPSRLGTTREWALPRSYGKDKVHVTATPRGQQTRVRIRQSLEEEIGGVFGGFSAPVLMLSVFLPIILQKEGVVGPALALIMGLLTLILTVAALRWGMGRYAASQRAKLHELAGRVETALAAEPDPAPQAAAEEPAARAVLQVPEPEDAAEPRASRSRSRTSS